MRFVFRLGLITCMVASAFTFNARAEIIPGYPDIIVCSTKGAKYVLRLQKVLSDGTATYAAELTGGVIIVGPDKILRREGDNDCNGKSLDELKRDGQTWELTK